MGLILGLGLLLAGSEALVRAGSRLALLLGLPPLLVGMVLIGCGTSLPELLVSVNAARTGSGALALGNVIGSNLFNILFILGLTASAIPLTGGSALLPDVLQMIGFTALLALFVITGMRLQRWEGTALLLLYFVIQYFRAP